MPSRARMAIVRPSVLLYCLAARIHLGDAGHAAQVIEREEQLVILDLVRLVSPVPDVPGGEQLEGERSILRVVVRVQRALEVGVVPVDVLIFGVASGCDRHQGLEVAGHVDRIVYRRQGGEVESEAVRLREVSFSRASAADADVVPKREREAIVQVGNPSRARFDVQFPALQPSRLVLMKDVRFPDVLLDGPVVEVGHTDGEGGDLCRLTVAPPEFSEQSVDEDPLFEPPPEQVGLAVRLEGVFQRDGLAVHLAVDAGVGA